MILLEAWQLIFVLVLTFFGGAMVGYGLGLIWLHKKGFLNESSIK